MTDKELLELAAKAAEIEVTAIVADGIPHRIGGGYWNPLTDDGDALRLAVKLQLVIVIDDKGVAASWMRNHKYGGGVNEKSKSDISAATRRAIVRAAAAIREQMP